MGMSPLAGFNPRKAAQVAAFFLLNEGRPLRVRQLLKLIYLADRWHLRDYDFPILMDEFVSTERGPINLYTSNYISGNNKASCWDAFVTKITDNKVDVVKCISIEDLDELSISEMESLETVWYVFGGRRSYELHDWMLKNCKECKYSKDSYYSSISYSDIFSALWKENSVALEERITDYRKLCTCFKKLNDC